MSIKDRVMLGPVKQALIMYWCMWNLWGPVNILAYVTIWSNHNRYSMLVVGGRMRKSRMTAMAGRSLWNQDFIPSVEERFRPWRDLAKGSQM
jgi:hypothetical protein